MEVVPFTDSSSQFEEAGEEDTPLTTRRSNTAPASSRLALKAPGNKRVRRHHRLAPGVISPSPRPVDERLTEREETSVRPGRRPGKQGGDGRNGARGWTRCQIGGEVKGRLSERGSSWKMADSFHVREREGSQWSRGDVEPSSPHRPVILLFHRLPAHRLSEPDSPTGPGTSTRRVDHQQSAPPLTDALLELRHLGI
ncbi:unnamed protein product [Pleuronectes platessa]|uniref:Uncharacterized protein n=1 Tax=Pleuronectes platessa TaxID=8262 RepID=A0A9N7TMS0_PLEPL|nr:unnamed protein product [Pleuronectes platessa]